MGLGLSSFLNHDKSSSNFLADWKKEGMIVIWLHKSNVIAWPIYYHSFIEYGTFKDKDSGKSIDCLRFPKYVSPDSELINKNQYFRNADDTLQIDPVKDPFLLLREWLRHSGLPLDTVVFEWENPNPKADQRIISWQLGHLTKLVQKTKATFNSTIDSKLDYLFNVVNNAKPADGLQIARVTRSLGDKMRKTISHNIENDGDNGNPLISPYSFKWIYDKGNKNPNDVYDAFRYNQPLTPIIQELINSKDVPSLDNYCSPQKGDKKRIMAAMQASARIQLPWDDIFPDTWDDEEIDSNTPSDDTGALGSVVDVTPRESVSRHTETNRGYSVNSVTPSNVVPMRRKKVEPKPKPVQVEMVPCDDCGKSIPITMIKCSYCGCEYEIQDTNSVKEISTINQAQVETRVSNQKEVSKLDSSSVADIESRSCWSCGSVLVNGVCPTCGLADDDIPF